MDQCIHWKKKPHLNTISNGYLKKQAPKMSTQISYGRAFLFDGIAMHFL